MATRTTAGRRNGTMTRETTRTIERDKGGAALVAATISFTAAGTIEDSGNGLAVFKAGQRIEVRGSASNNGQWTVATSAAGALTVLPGTITTEDAGATVTLISVEN